MISTSQVESTLTFQVNVTTENNQFSADVANIIAELAPDEIVRVLKVGGVEVIDYASAPSKPSSPNLKRMCLSALLLHLLRHSQYSLSKNYLIQEL